MFVFTQTDLDVGAEFEWMLGPHHSYSESVEVLEVLFDKVKTAEPSEHVVDGHETRIICVELRSHLYCSS